MITAREGAGARRDRRFTAAPIGQRRTRAIRGSTSSASLAPFAAAGDNVQRSGPGRATVAGYHCRPMKHAVAFALSAAFACLTAGCPIQGECGGEVETTIDLSPEEYAPWKYGGEPAAPTSGDDGDAAAGEPLDPQDACEAYCRHRYDGTFLWCQVDEGDTKVVVTCDMFYECHQAPR